MSFMNSGAADCSTGNNPLAQFSKQTNTDRSLQQSAISQHHRHAQPTSSIRQHSQMNAIERENFDRFQNSRESFPNFQPLNHELNSIARNNNNNNANWSNDFQQVHHTVSPVSHTPQILGESRIESNWNQDFLQQGQQQQGQQQGQQQHQRGGYGRMYSPMMTMMNRPMLQGQVHSHSQAQLMEVDKAKWDEQFSEIEQGLVSRDEEDVIDDKYKANFDEVWDSLNSDFQNDEAFNAEYEASWEKDYNKYASGRLNYGQYKFTTEDQNRFMHRPDAYEIGVRLMESGARLSEAALAFEAAVQQDDKHIEAWLKLGLVQTQNEKEVAGITAFEKCLELDAGNLKALMSLAISYVNEGYDNAAYATLERWLETKYPQITSQARVENPVIADEDRYSLNKRITELYIKAAQLSPDGANMDAEVQTGLGVLFYSMEEFDKTIDCFQAAIRQNPEDPLMWNRLGASLANSNRNEESIEAYSKALQLNPNFVRARYNLGVSCLNMGLYQQACEHLLAGLSMHEVGGVEAPGGSLSLVETLKRAFLAMDRRDLIEKIKPGMNLNQFRSEFNF